MLEVFQKNNSSKIRKKKIKRKYNTVAGISVLTVLVFCIEECVCVCVWCVCVLEKEREKKANEP